MGCHNSKTGKVAPAGVDNSVDKKSSLKRASKSLKSLDDREVDSRESSATSKTTKHSNDSGFGKDEWDDGEDDENEYGNIITEDSEEILKTNVEKEFQQVGDLDLCLTGTPAPRNWSAKDKARLDEQRILESLRNEGLIATSKFECRSGLAFEVIEENQNAKRALPARLAKLEKRKKKKKKLTQDDINNKLQQAEQRRKEAEAEKLEKIHTITSKSDITNTKVRESFAHQTQEIKEHVQVKVDTATENREKRLQELKDKLRAREEHAAKVRLRKKLHIPTEEEINAAEEEVLMQQDLPKTGQ